MSAPDPSTHHSNSRWSSRSIGSSWQHQFFYLMIRIGGRHLAYLFLMFVVTYYMLLRPDQRRKTLPYLEHRFPREGHLRRWGQSYRMSYALGQSLIDRAIVGIMGPGSMKAKLHGQEEVLALEQEGQGLIVLGAHVGCWQAAMAPLSLFSGPVNMLMQRETGDVDRHYFEHQGQKPPYKIIDPRGDLGGVLEMMAALKRGEVLSIMGDRMLGEDINGVEVDFLGGRVTMPFSAYKLASVTGAPIVVLLSFKTGAGSYELKTYTVIRVPGNLGRGKEVYIPYVQQFATALENYCHEHAFQFFNFFDMWQNVTLYPPENPGTPVKE